MAIVIPVLVGGWLATRAVYFIGTEPGPAHSVTIYRGLPYELPFGIDLYETLLRVRRAARPPSRRPAATSFTDHQLRSRDDAEDLVIAAGEGPGRVTARNRELLALVPASLLLTLGFAAIFIQQSAAQSDLSLTYGLAFLALCLAGTS